MQQQGKQNNQAQKSTEKQVISPNGFRMATGNTNGEIQLGKCMFNERQLAASEGGETGG